MPLASAAGTPNLVNTLDKDKFVNAVSNNANTDKNTALNKEEKAKLLKLFKDETKDKDSDELKLGSKGDEVNGLQIWLKENKFYAGEIDGNYGTDTETAVKNFQKVMGLREDGQVGDYTLLAMQQWDEYEIKSASTGTTSAKSSANKVYTKASTKASYSTARKTYGKSYGRGRGYINGMDCWAMSDRLASKYRSQGYLTRIVHARTSLSSDHRWVEVNDGSGWHAAPDYSSLPKIYAPTY
jgi:N-acetylmuramoyl-L-alanine amidase